MLSSILLHYRRQSNTHMYTYCNMSQKSSSVTMRVFVVALCISATLARPEDAKVEKKLATKVSTAAPTAAIKQETPIPNISEDILDKALNDRRFIQRQIKCATDEGPCDPIGRKIKAHAPLVLRGMCFKCSQSEIKQIQRVMSHIQKNYPKEYAKVLKQYQNSQNTPTSVRNRS